MVNINNGLFFASNFINKDGLTVINVKNILFCLDYMKDPIEKSVYEKYQKLNAYDMIK